MRLPDDDELYDVDQTYLGPPGRYIGVMRHKTIFAALVILPLLFVGARRLGIPFTLLTVGLLFIGGLGLSMTIADQTSNERPVLALLSSLWHDLTARRAPAQAFHASGEGYRAVRLPSGPVPRLQRRSEEPAPGSERPVRPVHGHADEDGASGSTAAAGEARTARRASF